MSYATYEQLSEQAEQSLSEKVVLIKSTEHKSELLSKNAIVLVDIYADWCGPCKNIEQSYKDLAQKYTLPGQCVFAKENIDMRLTQGISGVPSFMLYKNGQLVETMVGSNSLGNMEELLKVQYQSLSPSFNQVDPNYTIDRMSPQVSKVIRQYRQKAPILESAYNPVVTGSHVGYATYDAPVPSRR